MSDEDADKWWDVYWDSLDEEGRKREREMMDLHYEDTLRRRLIEGES